MKTICEGCNKISKVKDYYWQFQKDNGIIRICEECLKSYKYSGYKLKECN
jgi:hypothetical protein